MNLSLHKQDLTELSLTVIPNGTPSNPRPYACVDLGPCQVFATPEQFRAAAALFIQAATEVEALESATEEKRTIE